MGYETIRTENDGGVLVVTLNRPERLNAWTYQRGAELADAMERANAHDEVVAMVFTGAGPAPAGGSVREL